MEVGAAMICYSPSRHYLSAGLIAMVLGGFSGWVAWQWAPAWIAAALFFLSGILLLILAGQPAVRVSEEHLIIGKRVIAWDEIVRLDKTSWISPLIVHLSLTGDRRVVLVYPGDVDSGASLLRHLRRCARGATIDGKAYRDFWKEMMGGERRRLQSPRYRLLRPEDEQEVERMFQMLKTVGHLEKSPEDKK